MNVAGLRSSARGLSLLEVLVGVALMLIIFLGFFDAYKLAADVNVSAKERAGAVTLLESEMEYVRMLPYASVGVVGGSPSGVLPATATLSPNGIPYTVAVSVAYVDDPADGTGASDTNGITHDYKAVTVTVSWTFRGQVTSLTGVTYAAPVGVETS